MRLPLKFQGATQIGKFFALAAACAGFATGCGPSSDFNSALAKAKAGDLQAQVDVGMMYLEGKSVTMNSTEGLNWIKQAALKGHPAAQRTYGMLLRVAPPGSGKPEQAREWLEMAANQNDAPAQVEMANMLGLSTPPHEFVEAMKWALIAEKNGATNAAQVIKLIEAQMSATQIAEARSKASAFKPEAGK
jgi:TPR repeat protein